jgi:rhodanese-related sulfurtransferase
VSFFLEYWYLFVVAAVSGGMLLWPLVNGSGGGISVQDAVLLINRQKAQVIDVSTPEEFAAAHIAGAKNLPLQALDTAKGLPSNKKLPLVVVCARGARAAQAKPRLMRLGHEEVHVLAGGLSAWQQAQLPVEKSA